MKRSLLLAAIFCALPAFAQHRHAHGEGRLDVAVDGDRVVLDLELPLDATVGFERAPKNEREQAALGAAEQALKDAAGLWILSPAADCRPEAVQVGLPKFDGGHADIDASYVFRCRNGSALAAIETTLFRQFRRLYRLEVQRSGPQGQGAARLTPKKPALAW